MRRLETYFEGGQPTSEQYRINIAISLINGLDDVFQKFSDSSAALLSWDRFKRWFLGLTQEKFVHKTALQQLQVLRQGKSTVQDYALHFNPTSSVGY